MMKASEAASKPNGTGADHLARFADAQQRGTASMAQASEIMMRTANAVLQKQAAFFQYEAAASLKGLGALRPGTNGGLPATDYLDTLHSGIERAVTDAREISDVIREGAWQMFALYAGLWPQATKRAEP
jgi:hypothetical protein